jgi:hypothetical protein
VDVEDDDVEKDVDILWVNEWENDAELLQVMLVVIVLVNDIDGVRDMDWVGELDKDVKLSDKLSERDRVHVLLEV